MKIAVSSTGKSLTAKIDPRFGRCAYFAVIETDSMNIEVFQNENKDLNSGAGIQAATFVASKGVQAVITGNCGPNAIQVLTTAGIDLYTGENGKTVNEAVERFKNGILSPVREAAAPAAGQQPASNTVPGQPGMPPGSGRGMGSCGGGMGGGRGRGGCRKGSGMGGGRGMGGRGGGMGSGRGRGMV